MRAPTRNWVMSEYPDMGDASRYAYLQALGIQRWVKRRVDVADAGETKVQDPAAGQISWEALETAVSGCTKCGLHTSRTQTVFGVGVKLVAPEE